jgi:hypothetical protein
MKLYEISDKGELLQIEELSFQDDSVYLIDDFDKNTIYIWVGLEVAQYKKDITAAYARKFDKERENTQKILIMKQKREYGSFLAMIDDLNKGLIPGKTSERRVELILEESSASGFNEMIQEKLEDDQNIRISEWLNQLKEYRGEDHYENIATEEMDTIIAEEYVEGEEIDFDQEIRKAAYFLSLERYTYNDLCWLLAEKILIITIGMPSLEEIKKKAEQVFNSSSTYDELCWLNAEMDTLIRRGYLEKKKRGLL